MNNLFSKYVRRFRQRSALRLAVFAVLPLVAVFAPEPYSRFAAALATLINFLSYESLLKKYRDLAGLSGQTPPDPPEKS